MQTLEHAPDAPTGASVWQATVDSAIELLASRPLHEISMQLVADNAGLPVPAVLEQAADLGEVLIAAIQEWNERRMQEVQANAGQDGAVKFLRDLLQITISDPTCARMVMTAASMAGSPGHPMADPLQRMWLRFHAIVQRALVHDVSVGREPDTMSPANGAEQLLAVYEGLQIQWMFRPHMDLLAAYDRATTRLRRGWSEDYLAPVWTI